MSTNGGFIRIPYLCDKDRKIKMNLSRAELIWLLRTEGEEAEALFDWAAAHRKAYVGEKTYLRGLIEYSNVCRKNCLYCGIRRENDAVERYTLSEAEVLAAARYAWENRYGSIVLQGGENTSEAHVATIEGLIRKIKALSNSKLGITLSLGEQTEETCRRWFAAGAHRYLLRIESSREALYRSIHPDDAAHRHADRLEALRMLRRAGYQVGTGVMIGLPGQTVEDLADDLLFLRAQDIDMCGMGPYLEHEQTPLYARRAELQPPRERLVLTLKMIALLRLLMPDINIAATTALQAIDPRGREMALRIGANVVMPNLTPGVHKAQYKLYENKPVSEWPDIPDNEIGYDEWGDSRHFATRTEREIPNKR
jgi:biotin synthase